MAWLVSCAGWLSLPAERLTRHAVVIAVQPSVAALIEVELGLCATAHLPAGLAGRAAVVCAGGIAGEGRSDWCALSEPLTASACAAGQVDGADVVVAPAHGAGRGLVAPPLPLTDRVLAIPGLVCAAVEIRQAQLVAVGHVQVDPRRGAARVLRRHGGLRLEVHHHGACAVLRRLAGDHAQGKVATVAVHLADARH